MNVEYINGRFTVRCQGRTYNFLTLNSALDFVETKSDVPHSLIQFFVMAGLVVAALFGLFNIIGHYFG